MNINHTKKGIPRAFLAFGAGYIFSRSYGMRVGAVVACAVVLAGASAGAMISFFLGRRLLRGVGARLSERFPIMEALDSTMSGERALTVLILTRMSPVVPFNIFNYVVGGTSASAWHNAVSLMFMGPEIAFLSFVGAGARNLADYGDWRKSGTGHIAMVAVGVVVSGLTVGYISWYAKKELEKIAAGTQRNQSEEEINLWEDDEKKEEEANDSNMSDVRVVEGLL